MRVRIVSTFLAILACGAAGLRAQEPKTSPEPPVAQQQPIVKNVSLVNVLFNVLSARNKIIADMEQKDFKVFDDNVPQEIRFFSRQTDLPLRVGLLLDTSNSIRQRLQFEQEAAVDFLFSVIRKDKDQAFLMSVDDDPEIVQSSTSDLDRLRDAIQKQRAGGGTALYDAVYTAAQQLATQVPQSTGSPLDARGVLVVISDGDDNISRHTRGEALEIAQRAGIVIYTISTSTDWIITDQETNSSNSDNRKYLKTDGDRTLEQFAADSGGQSFFPYHVDDLARSFNNIGTDLRSQYSLAYVPTSQAADGKFHTIRIETGVKGLKIQARKGYFATAPQAAESAKPSAP
jgi:Ca-activated chloride channel family protein